MRYHWRDILILLLCFVLAVLCMGVPAYAENPALTMGETAFSIVPNSKVTYNFTPTESGYYRFTVPTTSVYLHLYDVNERDMGSSVGDYSANTEEACYELTGGQTYKLVLNTYSYSGNLTITVSKTPKPVSEISIYAPCAAVSAEVNGQPAEIIRNRLSAAAGDTVSLTVKPDDYCTMSGHSAWVRDGRELLMTETESDGAHTYIFSMPTCDVEFSFDIDHPGHGIWISGGDASTPGPAYVTPSRYWGQPGDEIILTVTKLPGITVDELSVAWWIGESQLGKKVLAPRNDGTYSFPMPDNDAYINIRYHRTGRDYEIDRSALPESVSISMEEADGYSCLTDSANAGDLVEIYPINCKVNNLRVTTADGQAVEISNGEYSSTFTMPAQNVRITGDALYSIMLSNQGSYDPAGTVQILVNGEAYSEGYSVRAGDSVSITASPNAGQSVTCLAAVSERYSNVELDPDRSEPVNLTKTGDNTWTFTMPENSVAVRYAFGTSITVHYDANGGSGTMADAETDQYASFTLPACEFEAPSGMMFIGWEEEENSWFAYPAGSVTSLQKDTTFVARWGYITQVETPDHAKISIRRNGETVTLNEDSAFGTLAGEEITVEILCEQDYDVEGISVWSPSQEQVSYSQSGHDGRYSYKFTMPSGTTYLYFQLTHPGYDIWAGQPVTDGDKVLLNVTVEKAWALPGEEVSFTVTKSDELTLDKVWIRWWHGYSEQKSDLQPLGDGRYSFIMPEANVTIETDYRITGRSYAIDRSTLPEAVVITVQTDDNEMPTVSANEGDRVYIRPFGCEIENLRIVGEDGRTIPIDGDYANMFFMPAQNVTITADIVYRVSWYNRGDENGTFRVEMNGSAIDNGNPVSAGTKLTITAIPEDGYLLSKLSAEYYLNAYSKDKVRVDIEEEGDTRAFFMPERNVEIEYAFGLPVTVSFEANGGSGTMADVIVGQYADYKLPECAFTPPAGMAFAGWGDFSSDFPYQPGEECMLTQNIRFIALWETACFSTPDFVLPENIGTIGDNAFEGIAARVVEIPEGCGSIGAGAFRNCRNLTQIRIPESIDEIADTAFDGCGMVYIFSNSDVAEEFCSEHANCVFVGDAVPAT